ncbi:glycosyl hydrolase family 3 [Microbacterium sp. CH12i]|uniref:glycoside hydrolase family 3 N-terminal domain-containing protein n=1 Tax=Microbacterium sp. CH12i TaxID=1479651 RepID=UPI0004618944|nr:glycoside hydrolase family 3 N-terminal domain-containing protein [Microbacterium sp. CH12i]KDA06246.1 glycosyl hydrolase family 3 [Microbacterium sp. CH12i]
MARQLPLVLAVVIATTAVLAPATVATADGKTTVVQEAKADAAAAHAAQLVSEMTTAEQAASIVMGHISTHDPAALSTYMAGNGLGGFILMGGNVPGTEADLQTATAALSSDPALPPLIAIDQEGGDVSRLPWDTFAASSTLKDRPAAETAAAFAARASLVARSGANVNFGIVADTTPDPSSFIYSRSLGADPQGAAERVAAAVSAEEPFVASTLKHFPGHGAAPGDSHQLIPSTGLTLDQWHQADALPFIAGIDAGASLLMFGHLDYTAVDDAPASLSARWHQIARDDLGFEGVIVTDDLGMLQSTGLPAYADPVANAVSAVVAGNDLVLTIAHSTPETAGQLAEGIAAAVGSGALPAERLQDAAERVMKLRLELAASSAVWAPCADCAPAS